MGAPCACLDGPRLPGRPARGGQGAPESHHRPGGRREAPAGAKNANADHAPPGRALRAPGLGQATFAGPFATECPFAAQASRHWASLPPAWAATDWGVNMLEAQSVTCMSDRLCCLVHCAGSWGLGMNVSIAQKQGPPPLRRSLVLVGSNTSLPFSRLSEGRMHACADEWNVGNNRRSYDARHLAWHKHYTRGGGHNCCSLSNGSEGRYGANTAALSARPDFPARLRAAQPARGLRPSHCAPWPKPLGSPSKHW